MKYTSLFKTLITYLFFFAAATTACAQTIFGLRAGVNIANISNLGNKGEMDAKAGFYFGVLAERMISERFLIRPEIIYSGKGYIFLKRYWNGTEFIPSTGYLHLNYISVPVLAGFRPEPDLTLFMGPEFSFLVGARAQPKFGGRNTPITNYSKFDLGIDIGISYQINKKFGAEMRYGAGLAKLTTVKYRDFQGNLTGTEKRGTNKLVQIGLYLFLGKNVTNREYLDRGK